LLGAGLLFWGWQTASLPVAIVLAVLVELPRWTALRFELRPGDLARVADFTTLAFLGLAGVFAATRGVPDAVLSVIQWLPAVLAPVVLAQLVSSAGRIPLSALFRYHRRLRRREPAVADPRIDVSGPYLALCVIGAGAANVRGAGYYLGLFVLAAWALYSVRPQQHSLAAWAAALVAAGAAGYAGQAGLGQLQATLESWFIDLQLRGMDADPYRNVTDLGSIGRLKLHDTIVLRVYADPRSAARVERLHRASYTQYVGTTWRAGGAALAPLIAAQDGATWTLAPGAPDSRVRIAIRLEDGKALLALPPGAVRVSELPAREVRRNALAAVQAHVGGDRAQYVAESAEAIAGYAAPDPDDLALPGAERAEFERLALELGLHGVPAAEALRRVEAHFAAFTYSTFRESPPAQGTTVLGDFLTRTQSGHCEYFAAATTLVLRAAGIPARYATGFSVQEYSPLEKAYVVRARHAHAWVRAWTGGSWVDVDTTPPAWFAEEARLAPFWQGFADVLRWAAYRWSQRGAFDLDERWGAILGVLVASLAWSMLRRRGMAGGRVATEAAGRRVSAGTDSEFYAVERVLAAKDSPRAPGEPLAAWAERVGARLDEATREQFARALGLHQRLRFDPIGLDASERAALQNAARALVTSLDRTA
jgi:hypothetical protein